MSAATIVSVNVGRPRAFQHNGRSATSSIWKSPVDRRVAVRGVNVEGDDQADREVHGGPDKAVYAYALEDVRFWERELGRALELAAVGENLTTEHIDVTGAVVGARWAIGSAEFEVSEPRAPCWKLAHKMDDPTFIRRFTKAGRPGAYLRIVREGEIGAGDEIRILSTPAHRMTVGDVFRIYSRDRDEVAKLVAIPELSQSWRSWAERKLRA
jgi:MOSC domain-containing protein YiiM